jgi:hypothetical protein
MNYKWTGSKVGHAGGSHSKGMMKLYKIIVWMPLRSNVLEIFRICKFLEGGHDRIIQTWIGGQEIRSLPPWVSWVYILQLFHIKCGIKCFSLPPLLVTFLFLLFHGGSLILWKCKAFQQTRIALLFNTTVH